MNPQAVSSSVFSKLKRMNILWNCPNVAEFILHSAVSSLIVTVGHFETTGVNTNMT